MLVHGHGRYDWKSGDRNRFPGGGFSPAVCRSGKTVAVTIFLRARERKVRYFHWSDSQPLKRLAIFVRLSGTVRVLVGGRYGVK